MPASTAWSLRPPRFANQQWLWGAWQQNHSLLRGHPKRRELEPLLGVFTYRPLEQRDCLTQRVLGVARDVAIDPARLPENDLVVSPPAAQRHHGHHGRAGKPGELERSFLERRLGTEELDTLDRGIGL